MFRWSRRRWNGNQGNRDLEEAVRILEELLGFEEVPAPITRTEPDSGHSGARRERQRGKHSASRLPLTDCG